jgi:MFS family permease
MKDYFNEKKLYIPYIVAAGVEIWWALIYIYIPLFMINNNMPLEYIGYFLAAITIPTMLFEYPAGKLSVKRGFKWFFVIGYLLLGLSAIIAYFITDIFIILIIMTLASIPMSFIEPLQDSFFFKRVRSIDEEKYFPIFASSGDIGAFIGHFSIATLLLFVPNNFAYLGVAVFMILIALICLKINDKHIYV